jgi:hypothetical protein
MERLHSDGERANVQVTDLGHQVFTVFVGVECCDAAYYVYAIVHDECPAKFSCGANLVAIFYVIGAH